MEVRIFGINRLAFDGNERLLAVTAPDQLIHVFDIRTGSELEIIDLIGDDWGYVQFDLPHRRIAVFGGHIFV